MHNQSLNCQNSKTPRLGLFRIAILLILLSILIMFNGCLFMKPYTPSARLVKNTTMGYTGCGLGAISYTYFDYDYDYFTDTYSETTEIRLMPDFLLAYRFRPGADFELGLLMRSWYTYTLDIKYALTDPKEHIILVALNALLHVSFAGYSIGGGIGPNINFVLSDENKFDLVVAAYYNYFDYHNSSHYGYSYDYEPIAPNPNNFYFYGGLEFSFINDSRLSIGGGYTYFPLTENKYDTISFEISVTYPTIGEKKDSASESMAITRDIEPEFYIKTAQRYIRLKQYREALAFLSKGIDKYPDDYFLNYLSGDCHYALARKRQAYIYYRKALDLIPGDVPLESFLIKLKKEILNE